MTIPNFIFLFILSLFIPVGLGSSQQLTCGKIFAHSGEAGSGEGTGGREDQRKRHISVAEKARYEETYFIDFSKGPSRVLYSRKARFHHRTGKDDHNGAAGAKNRHCINLGTGPQAGRAGG